MTNNSGDIQCDGCKTPLTFDGKVIKGFKTRTKSSAFSALEINMCYTCDANSFGDNINIGWKLDGEYEKDEML